MVKAIIGTAIMVLVLISFFVSEYRYDSTYNIWAESEDRFTDIAVFLAVILILAIVMAIFMIPAVKKVKKITAGKSVKKLDADALRKISLNGIKVSISEIILFLLISEDTVATFAYKNLGMDFIEAEFLAGKYQIFENHFLFFAVCTVFVSIIDYFSADSQAKAGSVDNCAVDELSDQKDLQEKGFSETPAYMICPHCKFEQPSNRKVCWKCGLKFENSEADDENEDLKCPFCQKAITDEMTFCGSCGSRIKED